MKKYVIGYEENCMLICKTLADAEEIILSIAEENVYENWFVDNCCSFWSNNRPYETPAEYIASNGKNYQKVSAWGWALYSYSSSYWIDEVEEIE